MNLHQRSVRVILPVILLSFCIAVAAMFFVQRDAVLRLEQARLDLTLQSLSASLRRYLAFSESFSHSILHSYSFIQDLDQHDKETFGSQIRTHVMDASEHLRLNSISHFEFDYYDAHGRLLVRYLSPQQTNHSEPPTLQQGWDLLPAENGSFNLVVIQEVDMAMMAAFGEQPFEGERLGHIVVRVGPDDFNNAKKQAESLYGVKVNFSRTRPSYDSQINSIEQITANSYLSINPSGGYLNKIFCPLFIKYVVFLMVFFSFAYFLLLILIRRHITRPIASLDNSIEAVIGEHQDRIEVNPGEGDEIYRLATKFNYLYQNLKETITDTRILAERDSLTNLYNFAFMSSKVADLIEQAREQKSMFAVVYIDLDNFKVVNDKYGHDVGDKLLKSFSRKLLSVVRESDLVFENDGREVVSARIGGDEFCIVVVDVENIDVVHNIANRVLSIFEKGYRFEQGTFPVTASVGVAIYPYHGLTISQLISNADTAMYQAKKLGKNQMAFYSESLAIAIRRRREIELGLKGLNCDHEFYVQYMPIVDAQTDTLFAVEALVRWQSSRLGAVGPAEFMPIAETCGLFAKVDYWVLDRVFQEVNIIQQSVPHDIQIAINISSANLNDNALFEEICRLKALYEVDPGNIIIEVTETFCVDFSTKAKETVSKLIELGFSIAIDDFGAGYTSLSQLLDYETHLIKLDREFVGKILQPDSKNLLKPIVELCHMKGLKVVAEGVETDEQMTFLRDAGCDLLQGYAISEPINIDALLEQQVK